MATTLNLGSLTVDVVKKDIKATRPSQRLPACRKSKISAPLRMKLDTIRVFAVSKLTWIKEQQKKITGQERETPRSYSERESHYLWGRRYLLKVVERDIPPEIKIRHSQIVFQVRPEWSPERKQVFLDAWYRAQLKEALPALLAKWEPLIGVSVERVFIQRMRTKWGSCSRTSPAIRLNTDLAKKPLECLEYIVVHEMAHLIEPTHNNRFITLMDRLMPNWRFYRAAIKSTASPP